MGVILNDPARLCTTVSITCSRSTFSAGPVHERQDRCYLDCILSGQDREQVGKVLPIGPINVACRLLICPSGDDIFRYLDTMKEILVQFSNFCQGKGLQ